MTQVPGLGPKKAMILFQDQGIADVQQLREAVDAGRLAGIKGFGAKTEENIRRGIARLQQSGGRVVSSVAMDVAEYFLERLGERKDVRRIEYAGSLRRMAETIGDLDLLVASGKPAGVMEAFTSEGIVERVLAKGDTKSSVLSRTGLQIDLRVVPLEAWGAAMIYFTGSKPHNIRIREMAVRKGLKLNEYGLFRREVGRADRRADRGGGLRAAGPALDPADAPGGPRGGPGRARGIAAGRAHPHAAPRRPAHAHQPDGRARHARGDARDRVRDSVTPTTR